MARPAKFSKHDALETPSNNLWVGNLATDVTDSDLMNVFARFGALDSVTTYSSRSYAFVFFKRAEDAKSAKNALQGTLVRGFALKIEFARPAKPCKNLWVGGISPSVTKEFLEEAFLKFGKIEDFKFVRDRNTAFIEFSRMEDASQALRIMNGKRMGGEQIRVDFLRSQAQPSKRDQWPDSRDGQFQGRVGPTDFHPTHKRLQYSQASGGRKGDGSPSKVLWIGYPPSLQIDEQMLHNAMILFGEIEKIKNFPSRSYSFVEFRSVDEARRAKEGLQGRLFNDPRISIMYSSSDLAPQKEFFSGDNGPNGPGPGPDMGYSEHSFRPLQTDMYGQNRPMMSNNFSGPSPHGGILGPNLGMRPLAPQGRFEPPFSGPEHNDLSALPSYQEGNSKNAGPNWRRPSPPAGMHTRPAWDVLDGNQFQRDSKRSRIDGHMPGEEPSFPSRKFDEQGLGLDPFANGQGQNRPSPVGRRSSSGGPPQAHPDQDHIWRGIIAKGGTPVCHARCVPMGKGVSSELPEVVNCSARTGLDLLTKHYAEAIGFEIVFFLPDSEDDFASYTEFLRYLGAKNRAGVAKFNDGTTLFLVPPSEFLTNVLKVYGPERLYGVVLKFPEVSQQQQSLPTHTSQYMEGHQIPISQPEYSYIPPKEERVSQMDYGRVLQEEHKHPPKPHFTPAIETTRGQDYNPNPGSVSQTQTGVSLTPELIATLSSWLPGNSHSSVTEPPKSSGPPIRPPHLPAAPPNRVNPSPTWKQDHQPNSDHMGNHYNLQGHGFEQRQSFPPVSNAQLAHSNTHFQDPSANQSMQFRPPSNLTHYNVEPSLSNSTHQSYGIGHGNDASGYYNPPVPHHSMNPATSSVQAYGVNSVPNQMQSAMPEKTSTEVSGPVQGTSEGEGDKNQRYQSTLQFAANLLLQIQQQQQAGRGPGTQQ